MVKIGIRITFLNCRLKKLNNRIGGVLKPNQEYNQYCSDECEHFYYPVKSRTREAKCRLFGGLKGMGANWERHKKCVQHQRSVCAVDIKKNCCTDCEKCDTCYN